jgi:hypothetical protein
VKKVHGVRRKVGLYNVPHMLEVQATRGSICTDENTGLPSLHALQRLSARVQRQLFVVKDRIEAHLQVILR